ncbi:MAG: 50S ribosomal protein L21, partial [Candidatus Limnocylindrales bacterium]
MTEELQGGNAPDTEASADVTTQASDEPTAAVAIAAEPAPTEDDASVEASAADAPTEEAEAAAEP